ncbi:hypothetical protein SAY86_002916 [Trapa natans]|uniref:Uncharacterized protein n=1 Tax=Trapa natans TaxID=22666 RepID=A0AAN7R1F5_TRANT|nr:hypothetical protein SAY86_002916 [Trapa natans]
MEMELEKQETRHVVSFEINVCLYPSRGRKDKSKESKRDAYSILEDRCFICRRQKKMMHRTRLVGLPSTGIIYDGFIHRWPCPQFPPCGSLCIYISLLVLNQTQRLSTVTVSGP